MADNKILIFIDWFLPGYKAGGPITSIANLTDQLSGEFEFAVITRNTDYCDPIPYPHVVSDAWNTLPNGIKVYYISDSQLSFNSLKKITRLLDFETVFVNGIYSLYFSIFPLVWFKYFHKKRVVISARGMLSEHTFSSKRLKKKLFYMLARITGLYHGVTFHATNDHEANQIRKNIGFKGAIRVAPNMPPKLGLNGVPSKKKETGELRLVSVARISPEKNTLYALERLKDLVQTSLSSPSGTPVQLTYDLYGTIYDEDYWQECQEIIAGLPSPVRVNYMGPIEKMNLHEKLTDYHFLFMPSQGENYGHAIVESFLAACPVIISDQTPWRNLKGVGWDLSLTRPEKFVEALKYCLNIDQEKYNALSKGAYDYGLKVALDSETFHANIRLFS